MSTGDSYDSVVFGTWIASLEAALHDPGSPSGIVPCVPSRKVDMPDGNRISGPQKQRECARIRVLHLDGRSWTVREAPLPFVDRRTGMSLIFESTSLIRRVRNYPPDWFDLPDAALFAISLGT
jgi:hypothetical protein